MWHPNSYYGFSLSMTIYISWDFRFPWSCVPTPLSFVLSGRSNGTSSPCDFQLKKEVLILRVVKFLTMPGRIWYNTCLQASLLGILLDGTSCQVSSSLYLSLQQQIVIRLCVCLVHLVQWITFCQGWHIPPSRYYLPRTRGWFGWL